ncbi:carboxylesterase [Kineococcus xinjiangensis]|uniref:Carboxylesterase n=1 Tax=Kineococcus xinjiangensis TaxID=512762 RepID=A0A2S6ITS8_9ACTN|nr:alpha/beta fold hydrolase [Kineococcus xinjiangensis]PPK97580.1 carboxylesterase [Kineococcus xinjiangensis]
MSAVMPGAEPFEFRSGSGRGVLLCHGFTGTPHSMRGWGEAFAAAGYDVLCPLLPGHGTTWQEMNRSTYGDWVAAAEAALAALRGRNSRIVVGGLSMGGSLALRLAQLHPEQVDALVLANPAVLLTDPRVRALPLVRRLVPSLRGIASDIKAPGRTEVGYDRTPLHALHSQLRGWREVRADLPRVRQPLLLARTAVDHVVPAASSAAVLAGVSSTDVTEIVYRDSYHVLTLDNDAPAFFAASVAFAARVLGTVQDQAVQDRTVRDGTEEAQR